MTEKCSCQMSRRRFLGLAGGSIACCALLPLAESVLAAEPVSRTAIFPKSKAKVGLVFSHVPSGRPTWPAKDYDYDARAKELTAKLAAACPKIDFAVSTATSAAEADAIVKASPDVDGFAVWCIGIWTGAANTIMHSGKPVVLIDDLFAGSGEILVSQPAIRKENLPVVTVSSSEIKDVADAVNLFAVMRAMKESAILVIYDGDLTGATGSVKNLYGATLIQMKSPELADYYAKTEEREAAGWADYWSAKAKKVVEPSREDLVKSGRMYLALARAAAEKKTDAVTMDCLGMFYSGLVTAYPCLSHFQMNNDGGTGVCEADIDSTCTQLMMRYLTGRPGYVSDPVIDTSKSEIIYAHCVSTNHVYGPNGEANPYIIRSHAEDGKGASVQSLMPANQNVTTAKFELGTKRFVIHSARTVGNSNEPKACRTKLAAKSNADNILANWDFGWHRVTVYGDYRKQCLNLARLYGYAAVEEDKSA